MFLFDYFHFYIHENTQAIWHNNEHSPLTILSPYKADGTKIWTFLIMIIVNVTKWWLTLVGEDRNWSSKSKPYSRCSSPLIWLLFSPRIVRIKSSYGTGVSGSPPAVRVAAFGRVSCPSRVSGQHWPPSLAHQQHSLIQLFSSTPLFSLAQRCQFLMTALSSRNFFRKLRHFSRLTRFFPFIKTSSRAKDVCGICSSKSSIAIRTFSLLSAPVFLCCFLDDRGACVHSTHTH